MNTTIQQQAATPAHLGLRLIAALYDLLPVLAQLPPGRYTVSGILPVEPDDPPELGRLIWIGLEPQFPTERAGLGIHHDPSAGLGRESGTDGCIGVIRGDDLMTLAALLGFVTLALRRERCPPLRLQVSPRRPRGPVV